MRHFLALLLLLLTACALREPPDPALFSMDTSRLPATDLVLEIPGLGPCTDSPDRRLHLNSREPLKVMVHGCFGSTGEFRALAQVFAFQGQQTACFTYDDRAGLDEVAAEMRQALGLLAKQSKIADITVIGHSQGALISRRALSDTPLNTPLPEGVAKELVTISGPFAGIKAAAPCGIAWLRPISLGLMAASCHLVTGAKWADITYSSRFIREPGGLAPQVSRHLKIDTDERNTCRRFKDGRCVESDEIFDLDEQRNKIVDGEARVLRLEMKAGHVEIVGDHTVAPVKLIDTLQAQGVLRPTPSTQTQAFREMLAQVYSDSSVLKQPLAHKAP